jgi:hypothetical protein
LGEVDDVDVGSIAGGDHAVVGQPDGASGVSALASHEEGQVESTVVAIAAHIVNRVVGSSCRRWCRRARCRAEARHGVPVGQHPPTKSRLPPTKFSVGR